MAEQLDAILPPVIAMARDDNALVRECACFCLGQWAEHLQPHISEHHLPILQAAFDLLSDVKNIRVQLHVCTVLENMCTSMEPSDIMVHIPDMFPHGVLVSSSRLAFCFRFLSEVMYNGPVLGRRLVLTSCF
jgi:hypothetical protein